MTKRVKDKADDHILDLPASAIVPLEIQSASVVLTLIGAPFRTPRGAERSLRYSMAVLDGDVDKALKVIIKNGGVFFRKADKKGARWFLPWPPAAIKISPYDAERQAGAGPDNQPFN